MSAERILLVDDEARFRTYLREPLEKAGYRVSEVAHFGEALSIIGREQFSLAIVDRRLNSSERLSRYEGDDVLHDLWVLGVLALEVTAYPGGPNDLRSRRERYGGIIYDTIDKRRFADEPGYVEGDFLKLVSDAVAAASAIWLSEGKTQAQQKRLQMLEKSLKPAR